MMCNLVDDASSLEVTMLVAADSKPSAGLDFEFELDSTCLTRPAGMNEQLRTLSRNRPSTSDRRIRKRWSSMSR